MSMWGPSKVDKLGNYFSSVLPALLQVGITCSSMCAHPHYTPHSSPSPPPFTPHPCLHSSPSLLTPHSTSTPTPSPHPWQAVLMHHTIVVYEVTLSIHRLVNKFGASLGPGEWSMVFSIVTHIDHHIRVSCNGGVAGQVTPTPLPLHSTPSSSLHVHPLSSDLSLGSR